MDVQDAHGGVRVERDPLHNGEVVIGCLRLTAVLLLFTTILVADLTLHDQAARGGLHRALDSKLVEEPLDLIVRIGEQVVVLAGQAEGGVLRAERVLAVLGVVQIDLA